MQCPDCRFTSHEEDLYCRRCGAYLMIDVTNIVPAQTHLPAVLQSPQLPRVAASVGALALGVGLELLRRGLLSRLEQSTPQAVSHALPTLSGLKDILFPQNHRPSKLPKGYEIHETVICVRRVIRRES
jgi:hypothetical protein